MIKIHSHLLLVLSLLIISTIAEAQSPLPDEVEVVKLADGFSLSEGPYWHSDGYLLFSDVSQSAIYKWESNGRVSTYFSPSGQSNGITADLYGNILIAQHSARQVGMLSSDLESVTSIANRYNGARLHSPNDLTVKSDGAIFFTDPPWGGNPSEINFHGVYRIPPDGGEPQLLVDSLSYPNGIAFSPDEQKLYVSETNNSYVHVFDVVDDSTLANGRVFAIASDHGNADQTSADGLKVDNDGNVWVTGSEGVVIFSPDGTLLDIINVPGSTTNIGFGGTNRLYVFITNFSGLYRVDLGPLVRPESPSNLSYNLENDSVHLTWDASSGPVKYVSVYRSTNGGTYEKIYAGPDTGTYSDTAIEPDSEYAYRLTVTDVMGFESELSEATDAISTSIIEGQSGINSFQLHQNYPNPFNPSTTIGFELASSARVSLSIHDMLGREIDVLLNNEFRSPGSHQVSWNSGNTPSGIYIYTLETRSGTFSKKLTLIK